MGYEHYFGLGVRELGYEHDSERFGEGYENCGKFGVRGRNRTFLGTPKAAIRGEIGVREIIQTAAIKGEIRILKISIEASIRGKSAPQAKIFGVLGVRE